MAIYRDEQGNIISRKSPVTGNGKKTEAQKRADRKYHAKTYRNLQTSVKIGDYNSIDTYCNSLGETKAFVIVTAIKYCMENNINLKEWSTNINAQDDTE